MRLVASGFSRTMLIVAIAGTGLAVSGRVATQPGVQPKYDLLLRGGHVIDSRNSISAVRDVAIAGGKIAAVADEAESRRCAEDGRRQRAVRDARTRRYPRSRLYRHG